MKKISPEFIRAIPKTDLHVHLDGSLRIETLIELAGERNIEIPSHTEEGMRELVFKERYRNLGDYLKGFRYTTAVMQDTEAVERISYELAVDSFSEGVRYIEPRFAPQLHINRELEMTSLLKAVDRGLSRAAGEFNQSPGVKNGTEPPYSYGIIVCALRMFGKGFSRYYDELMNVMEFAPKKKIFRAASLEMARAAVRIRDAGLSSIVGFDLAGQEDGFPAHNHYEAYQHAHRNFLHKTVHAGEAYGAESIFEAITELHADRVGHGFYLFNTDKITDGDIRDRDKYIFDLAEYIADKRITIEICLTSNLQTNATLKTLSDHPLKKMLEAKISTTFCTDNRLVSRTSISREIELALNEVGLDLKQLKQCIFNGFKRSFMPHTYLEKRDYVRKVINSYEKLETEYGIA